MCDSLCVCWTMSTMQRSHFPPTPASIGYTYYIQWDALSVCLCKRTVATKQALRSICLYERQINNKQQSNGGNSRRQHTIQRKATFCLCACVCFVVGHERGYHGCKEERQTYTNTHTLACTERKDAPKEYPRPRMPLDCICNERVGF